MEFFGMTQSEFVVFLLTNAAWAAIAVVVLFAKRQPAKADPMAAIKGAKIDDAEWAKALEAKEAVVTKEGRAHVPCSPDQYVPYDKYQKHSVDKMAKNAKEFYECLDARRTVRDYSDEKFPRAILEDCIRAAGTAPSGANLQPWTYVIVENAGVKGQIRDLVEAEEAVNYAKRMRESWKADLAHLGTDANKPYLDTAPYLVCVFKHAYRIEDGERLQVYYPEQSVGISVGMFQSAVHKAGLVTLTSTPMGAETGIRELLGRPENERLYLLMPVGYPAKDTRVPNISRKPLNEISAVV